MYVCTECKYIRKDLYVHMDVFICSFFHAVRICMYICIHVLYKYIQVYVLHFCLIHMYMYVIGPDNMK